MTDISVKNSLRSFAINSKLGKDRILDPTEASNISIQLTRIGKMLDESVLKFTKRYLIIQTELEEMKREFIGDVSLVNEFLNLTKKEIRYDKFDGFTQGKIYGNPMNIPKLPNYEHKAIIKTDKRNNKSAYLNYKKSNLNNTSNTTNTKKGNSIKQNKSIQDKKIKKKYKNDSVGLGIDSEIQNLNSSNYYTNQTLNSDNNELKKINNNKKKNKEEVLKKLPDNKTKAIYILLNSPVVSYQEKLKLLPTKKAITENINTNDIYTEALLNIENKINLLKQEPIEENEKIIINKIANYPSKTAKTGLTFLTKEKESELMIENEQNEKLLEMICVCLGENTPENYNNIKESYNNLFQKYNVDSIKNLFFEHIYKKIYNDAFNGRVTNNYIENIINCIKENKILITDILVSNINKTFSYVAFSLDEIYEFLNSIKDIDDDLKDKIKNEIELKALIEEEEKIRNMIK